MRRILHVDMDAFYASVEQRDRPELKGQPVIVGADPQAGRGRGVVAACSYEARAFGVRSALPISQAWRRCPQGVYLQPRFDRYQSVSREVMAILGGYSDLIEPLSIDEAFLDVSGSMRLHGPADAIARAIKAEIRRKTGLTASVGVASNKFLAKLASDLKKPDGLVIVPDDGLEAFLAGLPITKLWGVGPKTAASLERLHIRRIGDLAAIPHATMVRELGAAGDHLWRLAHGQDERPVVPHGDPKSISNETTFNEDTRDREQMIGTLGRLSDQVAARLRKSGFLTRTVTLKLRYANFETHIRHRTVPRPIDTGDAVFALARALFERFPIDQPVRLLGVGAVNLVRPGAQPEQLSLFSRPRDDGRLSRALDEIRNRFGDGAVYRASDPS